MSEEISPEGTGALANINRSTVAPGEVLPVVTLADGTRVQTGTVATLLRNIATYDRLVADGAAGGSGGGADDGDLEDLESRLAAAVPTLLHIGMFDLFSPEEWLTGTSPGRRWVGEVAQARLLLEDGLEIAAE